MQVSVLTRKLKQMIKVKENQVASTKLKLLLPYDKYWWNSERAFIVPNPRKNIESNIKECVARCVAKIKNIWNMYNFWNYSEKS